MHIIIADAFAADHVDRLRDAGLTVVHEPSLDEESLPARLAGCDVLVVRSTRVTADAIAAGDRLALIVRAGAGVNTIDVDAAARHGVLVANTPGTNSVAVAELTIGLLLAIDRSIPDAVVAARGGRWRKKQFSQAQGIAGRTLGIVGMGAIGLEVASRARALEMRVLTSENPDRDPETRRRIAELRIEQIAERKEMLAQCDVVSLHVPAPDGGPLVDAGFLDAMPDGAWLINTSRGDVVDENALLEALDHRGFRAGLDVVAAEPSAGEGQLDNALASHPSVYLTPHIGASTKQAQTATADAVVAHILRFAAGSLPTVLNLHDGLASTATLVVRHRNVVGVLAGVLGVLRGAGLNVDQMTNQIFTGESAGVAIINVHGDLTDDILDGVRSLDPVLGVTVSHR